MCPQSEALRKNFQKYRNIFLYPTTFSLKLSELLDLTLVQKSAGVEHFPNAFFYVSSKFLQMQH